MSRKIKVGDRVKVKVNIESEAEVQRVYDGTFLVAVSGGHSRWFLSNEVTLIPAIVLPTGMYALVQIDERAYLKVGNLWTDDYGSCHQTNVVQERAENGSYRVIFEGESE